MSPPAHTTTDEHVAGEWLSSLCTRPGDQYLFRLAATEFGLPNAEAAARAYASVDLPNPERPFVRPVVDEYSASIAMALFVFVCEVRAALMEAWHYDVSLDIDPLGGGPRQMSFPSRSRVDKLLGLGLLCADSQFGFVASFELAAPANPQPIEFGSTDTDTVDLDVSSCAVGCIICALTSAPAAPPFALAG